jgi:hypothetical protein
MNGHTQRDHKRRGCYSILSTHITVVVSLYNFRNCYWIYIYMCVCVRERERERERERYIRIKTGEICFNSTMEE